jgi:hypothetical protein
MFATGEPIVIDGVNAATVLVFTVAQDEDVAAG